MKIIKNSFLAEVVESERKYLEEDYKLFQKEDPSILGKITQKEFNEAYEIFYSRTYQYVNDKNNSVTGFVPLVDLFNYRTGNSNKVGWKYSKESSQFILYALDNIKKGGKVNILN